MKYITAKEAAERWGVTLRGVQKMCREGRVDGAWLDCGVWKLPDHASRPDSKRGPKRKSAEVNYRYFDPDRMVMQYTVGHAAEKYAAAGDDEAGLIYKLQYHAYRGETYKTLELIEKMKQMPEFRGTFFLDVFSLEESICAGDADGIVNALAGLGAQPGGDIFNRLFGRVMRTYQRYIELMDPSGELPKHGDFSRVDERHKPYVCYIAALRYYVGGQYGIAAGIAETALAFVNDGGHAAAELMLHLMVAATHMQLGNEELAKRHFMRAWEMIRADGFYGMLFKFRELLSGLEEICVRRDYPKEYAEYAKIIGQNTENQSRLPDLSERARRYLRLSPIEHAVNLLVSGGRSNTETAELLGISVNTVRAHMRSIFTKLDIYSREEMM